MFQNKTFPFPILHPSPSQETLPRFPRVQKLPLSQPNHQQINGKSRGKKRQMFGFQLSLSPEIKPERPPDPAWPIILPKNSGSASFLACVPQPNLTSKKKGKFRGKKRQKFGFQLSLSPEIKPKRFPDSAWPIMLAMNSGSASFLACVPPTNLVSTKRAISSLHKKGYLRGKKRQMFGFQLSLSPQTHHNRCATMLYCSRLIPAPCQ